MEWTIRNPRYISPYLLCSGLLFVSNLGFPPAIQYTTRALGIAVTWFCLLYCGRGSLKVKSIRHEPTLLIVLYLGICALSCFWSVSPFQSAMKVVELFTDFMLLERMARETDWETTARRTLDLYMMLCLVMLAISLAGFFVAPKYFANRGYMAQKSLLHVRLAEGFLGANKASALAALSICWLVLLRPWHGWRSAAAIGVCLIVMFLSQSRASLILLPVILAFRFFKYREKYRILYILAGCVVLGLLVLRMSTVIAYLMRGQTTDALLSGTGRTTIWSYALAYIKRRPFLGYGFGAGGELAANQFHGVATVHSGIFETLLGTGIVGLVILSFQCVYVVRIVGTNIIRQGLRANFFDAIFMMYFVIRSVTSLGVANWHSPELLIWWLFMFAIREGKGIQRIYTEANARATEARAASACPAWIETGLKGGVKESG